MIVAPPKLRADGKDDPSGSWWGFGRRLLGRRRGRALRLLALGAVLLGAVLLLGASTLIETSASLLRSGSRASASGATYAQPGSPGTDRARTDRARTDQDSTDQDNPDRTAEKTAETRDRPTPLVIPTAPPGWEISAVRTTYQGVSRYYLVARPRHVSATLLPMLVVLAGRDMTPARMESSSGFLPLVGQAVVVYPDGYDESWNAGYCCGAAHREGIDDVGFIEQVVRSVLSSQPGTSARDVYLAGFSNGGRMAYLMACSDPRAFAGVAAVEAVSVSPCSRASPVPLITVAQTGDPLLTIPIGARPKHIAGHTETTVDALVDHWRSLEGCTGPGDQTPYDSGALTVYSWTNCTSPGRVSLAVYKGGKHRWPTGGPGVPAAQSLIWSFFRPATSHIA